ncbi:MAG: hypothetical protein ACD_4C00416G0005 [uncultured bacterium (gcode 4)]|uniref:Uncharacterized protein n=1 Tax=uncultured bacterium (gcode 4) TaxID=1234023 RepID=K2G7W8_9BACT|nr:MAG: hypothetical protein ACD_4C00416G0005 [uncultured bacterium (gcode 4)]
MNAKIIPIKSDELYKEESIESAIILSKVLALAWIVKNISNLNSYDEVLSLIKTPFYDSLYEKFPVFRNKKMLPIEDSAIVEVFLFFHNLFNRANLLNLIDFLDKKWIEWLKRLIFINARRSNLSVEVYYIIESIVNDLPDIIKNNRLDKKRKKDELINEVQDKISILV